MLILGRDDDKPFCIDNDCAITFKDVLKFKETIERQLEDNIYLVPLMNTATSAALYASLIESEISFIVCGIREWEKARDSYSLMYNRKFATICEKCISNGSRAIGRLGKKMIYAEIGEAGMQGHNKERDKTGPSNGFMCLNTSGSSGTPKLVKITKENIKANTEGIIKSLNLRESDSAFVSLPLSYTYALSQINTSARVGASAWVTEKTVVQKEFTEELIKSNARVFAGVPFTYEMLRRLDYNPIKRSQLKKITQAGGRLGLTERKELYKLAEEMDAEFFIMYGQTEATARISCFSVNQFPEKIESVGKALSNVELCLGETGEIIIRGPSVTPGYIKKGTDFKELEKREYHQTGDIARLDDEGFIYIKGRTSRFSKIAGKRVNLDVVEIELEKKYGEKIYLVSDDDSLTMVTTNIKNKKEKPSIEGVHRSKVKWAEVADIPTTLNGKIDYKLLTEEIYKNEY